MKVFFRDRLNITRQLSATSGEMLIDVLRRNHIPQNSVIITVRGEPIHEFQKLDDQQEYIISLIEGYDINKLINLFETSSENSFAYLKKRFLFNIDGSIKKEQQYYNLSDLVKYVESNVDSVIREYKLLMPEKKVLIGLSGGVDSSALLMILSELKKKNSFDIVCATFEDFDNHSSGPYENAKRTTTELGVEHHLIKSNFVEKIFHLRNPLKNILHELMESEYAHFVMYIDHHTTRRALECYAESVGISTIALGLHTTDLLAGLLNSFATGFSIAEIPKRNIENITYIYPLAYIAKKELHLYYFAKKSIYAIHSQPNQWELTPQDRNYYYYLADYLQEIWPGIEYYFFEAHSQGTRRQPFLKYSQCCNCGSMVLQQIFAPLNAEYCDACFILKQKKYIA